MTGQKRTWQQVKIKYKNILQTAVKKRTHRSGTGGGPATPEFTPAEEVALDLNKGRPIIEGIQGGTSTDSVPPTESAHFIQGLAPVKPLSIQFCGIWYRVKAHLLHKTRRKQFQWIQEDRRTQTMCRPTLSLPTSVPKQSGPCTQHTYRNK
ncbi:hypothetical protein PFLUV_G00137980 [Perca fluviatilis]|uniref:Uncharacterized protein n=1 Tax=Perca fluviatilis TaxID=8168 RepID=A0A6A5EYB3_PERFL|nr:hypothetical protein PFLUV_G00137980 [Perca fluviatilis]